MIFLVLTILCGSVIGLSFKFSELRNMQRYVITTANYISASTIGFILIIKNRLYVVDDPLSLTVFLDELSVVILEPMVKLSHESSVLWAITIGLVAGVFYLLSFIYYQKSIAENGIALSAMSSRLGVLIPMTFSIVLWNELPDRYQFLGIMLAISSIVLVNIKTANSHSNGLKISWVILFATAGCAHFCNKLFQKYALPEYKMIFLFFVFFTALLLSFRWLHIKKQKARMNDVNLGIFIGVFNLMTNYFLIMALSRLKASIVFPITSAGIIITMTIGGCIMFGEKLKPKNLAAILMTLAAIVLINI